MKSPNASPSLFQIYAVHTTMAHLACLSSILIHILRTEFFKELYTFVLVDECYDYDYDVGS
jgi:hypothetical protein